MADESITANLKRTPNLGLILVPSRDYSLYAMNPINGVLAWQCTPGSPMINPAHPVNDRIYVIPQNNVLLSLDEVNGATPLWQVPEIRRFIAASPLTVFVEDTGGRLAAISPADGSVRFRLDIGGARPLLNEVDGQLFLANQQGKITCLREQQVNYPLPQDVRVRPPAVEQ